MKNNIGKIDISQLNTPPEKHELACAKFFAELGKDIVFLKPSSIPNLHTPDILMDGLEWEIKTPIGSSRRTIEENFRKAVKQSRNIIFDLRNINLPQAQCISKLEQEFNLRPYLNNLYVICKNDILIKYPKKT